MSQTTAGSRTRIGPQPGPQEQFLACKSDIGIYGGAAFGGKTFGILLEAARPLKRKGFDAVIFRRTYPQIVASGGLWDTSMQLMLELGAKAKFGDLSWVWPSGHRIMLRQLQHEKDKLNWQGTAIPLLCFDELTHFTQSQFFYLLSRNRMYEGAPGKPYVRATCNPDASSWVADFLSWWIDQETGLVNMDRAGKERWMGRDGDDILWADTAEELKDKGIEFPRSVSFIPASIADNKIGNERDPGYKSNLLSLPRLEREQLLYGNWKIRATAGMVFQRHWFDIIDKASNRPGRLIRYWDRAATEPSPQNPDPDWTAGCKMIRYEDGEVVILDMIHVRLKPGGVMKTIKQAAVADGEDCEIWLEEDPGQAGKVESTNYATELEGHTFRFKRPSGSKLTRALPASAQAEAKKVKLLRGSWNDSFLSEAQDFCDFDNLPREQRPAKRPHDDQVDAFSGGMGVFAGSAEPRIRTLANNQAKKHPIHDVDDVQPEFIPKVRIP